jgi:hypothetical protein
MKYQKTKQLIYAPDCVCVTVQKPEPYRLLFRQRFKNSAIKYTAKECSSSYDSVRIAFFWNPLFKRKFSALALPNIKA